MYSAILRKELVYEECLADAPPSIYDNKLGGMSLIQSPNLFHLAVSSDYLHGYK